MTRETTFAVPDELNAFVDDRVLETHARWQDVSLSDIDRWMPEPTETEYGRAVVLSPASSDYDESNTVILGLPHQQGWKRSMAVRAEFMRQAVSPDSQMIVLPNNTVGGRYYDFSDAEARTISTGDMRPFFEQRVRLLEELGVKGSIDLTGYSLGGLTAVGIASIGSDRWQARVINADEAPNTKKIPKELQQDFMKSGGWSDQRAAIADADLPALRQALSPANLAGDYARFGLATLINENKTMAVGMAGTDFNKLIAEAARSQPTAAIKLGHVVGSRLFVPENFDDSAIKNHRSDITLHVQQYSGEASHLHTTGDNAVAHALMFKQAVLLSTNAR